MSDTDYSFTNYEANELRQIGREIAEHSELLRTDLSRAQDLVEGDARYRNELVVREADHDMDRAMTLYSDNSTDFTVPFPASDAWATQQYSGMTSRQFVVVSHRRFDQPEVAEAERLLEEAKQSSNNVEGTTSDDLDALETIPAALARLLTLARRGKDFFESGVEDLTARAQAKDNDTEYWVGPGSDAYVRALDRQSTIFQEQRTKMGVVEQGCLGVADAVVALAQALAEVYKARVEQTKEVISDLLSIASGPTSWVTYLGIVSDRLADAEIQQIEDFQSSLEQLAQSERYNSLVVDLEGLKVGSWPHPSAGALAEQ